MPQDKDQLTPDEQNQVRFFSAVRENRFDEVSEILMSVSLFERLALWRYEPPGESVSILFWAAENNFRMFQHLMACGKRQGEDRFLLELKAGDITLLHWAARNSRAIFWWILHRFSDPRTHAYVADQLGPVFLWAVHEGRMDLVKLMLRVSDLPLRVRLWRQTYPSLPDENAFSWAAKNAPQTFVTLLRGATVEEEDVLFYRRDADGLTLLQWAAHHDQIELMTAIMWGITYQTYVKLCAQVGRDGLNLFQWAVVHDKRPILSLLFRMMTKIEEFDWLCDMKIDELNSFVWASRFGAPGLVEHMLKEVPRVRSGRRPHGLTMPDFSENSVTLLHAVVLQGDMAVLRILATDHVVFYRTSTGATPLHMAARIGQTAAATMLLEKSDYWEREQIFHSCEKIDERDDGFNPIHIAARYGHAGVIRAMHHAASPCQWRELLRSKTTVTGLTAYQLAHLHHHDDVQTLLLELSPNENRQVLREQLEVEVIELKPVEPQATNVCYASHFQPAPTSPVQPTQVSLTISPGAGVFN